ncbi:head GIN domain-containing protein [Williamwhitmania taraxaci]|uniref:Putative auto-transporter adhesin, head GIN domain n=1 Tax=Williamwhitmania taraxaci TaxID=1640674 RepID=A0A1G6HK98_9BACT|nr:head GIN domain-containing protein [Williamwhitmania taraxaci]SDB94528.1 Putative auto-transporter adhesin, head GIN domain [Williamwhitmania taraxaci]
MKRFILSAVFAISCAIYPASSVIAQVNYTRNLSDFDRVEVYGEVYCEISFANKQSARVEGIGITSDDLEIKVEGQTLRIKLKPRIYNHVEVKVFLTYQKIREIKTAGAAVLVCADTIAGDKLAVDALTSSTIRLQVNLSNLELKAGQGATIFAKGSAATLEAASGSKSIISAYGLEVEKAFASSTFGGMLKLHPTEYLEAKASVGGTIYYLKSPKQIKVSENLGGKVEEVSFDDETNAPDSLQ